MFDVVVSIAYRAAAEPAAWRTMGSSTSLFILSYSRQIRVEKLIGYTPARMYLTTHLTFKSSKPRHRSPLGACYITAISPIRPAV